MACNVSTALTLAGLAITSASCTSNVGRLRVTLVRSPDAAEDPLDRVAAFVRVRVDGPGGRIGPVLAPLSSGQTELPEVPAGPGQVITVEGLGAEGNPVSRGRTAPLTLHEGETAIELFVGLLNTFNRAPVAQPASQPVGGPALAHAYHAAVVLEAENVLLLLGGTQDPWRPTAAPAESTPSRAIAAFEGNSLRGTAVACEEAGACLRYARLGHTATLLPTGDVLIAGGMHRAAETATPIDAVEIYVASQRRTLLGKTLLTPRRAHSAVERQGQVVLVGGIGAGDRLTASSESYAGGFLGAQPQLAQARRDFALVRLADGTLMASGGFDEAGAALRSVELLSPQTARWRLGPPLTVARAHHTATLLGDGTVLLVGGLGDGDGATTAIERFSPARQTMESVAELHLGRWAHTATLLRDGRVLVVGGFASNVYGSPTNVVEELTISDSGPINVKQPYRLHEPRAGHTATLLPSGMLLVAGGITEAPSGPAVSPTAEVFIY